MVHKTEQNCKPLRFVHCGSIVSIEKIRADAGIGPYKAGADLPPAQKRADFCRARSFLITAGDMITKYTVGAAGCRPPGQKKKADFKRNRLLAKDGNLDGICARGRCAVLTRYSHLKNCGIMEVIYSNIPSAMRRFSSHSAVLLLSY